MHNGYYSCDFAAGCSLMNGTMDEQAQSQSPNATCCCNLLGGCEYRSSSKLELRAGTFTGGVIGNAKSHNLLHLVTSSISKKQQQILTATIKLEEQCKLRGHGCKSEQLPCKRECAANEYRRGNCTGYHSTEPTECIPCPRYSRGPPDSRSIATCTCIPGFYYAAIGPVRSRPTYCA